MITVLAGLLNGAAVGQGVVDFNHDDTTPTNTGQAIAALDVASFGDPDTFEAQVAAFADQLKDSRTLPGMDEVRLPGGAGSRDVRGAKPLGEFHWLCV